VVQLASDLGTNAVLGGASLAYGDLGGKLHLYTYDQVRTALATAPAN